MYKSISRAQWVWLFTSWNNLFICVLAVCKHHTCLLQVRIDSYFEVQCRILQTHMLADLLPLSNACKALALHYHLLEICILSCFMAVDITQHLQPKALLTFSVLSEIECLHMHPKILFISWANNGVSILKAGIEVKLKHSQSNVCLLVIDELLFH